MGHGHVTPNPDGSKARCGGPGMCQVCQEEQRVASFAKLLTLGDSIVDANRKMRDSAERATATVADFAAAFREARDRGSNR